MMKILFLKHALALKKHEKFSREELLKYRLQKLRNLVEYVIKNSPFYKDFYAQAGIHLKDVPDIQVTDLPITNKQLLQDHFDDVVTNRNLKYRDISDHIAHGKPENLYLGKYKILHTSGTDGANALCVYHISDFTEIQACIATRLSRMSMSKIVKSIIKHQKIVYFAHTDGFVAGFSLILGLPKAIYDLKVFSIKSPLHEVVNALNQFLPQDLVGYPSSIYMLAEEQLAGRLTIFPDTICCSGEMLSKRVREKIYEAFHVDPMNMYISTECAFIAYQHAHQPYLSVMDDMNYVEEGSPLLISNLCNRTFPTIRYHMTDQLHFVEHPDYRESPFSQIKIVKGHVNEFLKIKNNHGEELSIHAALLVEFHVEGLRKVQFWKKDENIILIKVCGDSPNLIEKTHQEMYKILKELNAEKSTQILVEKHEKIEANEKTGKFKLVNG